MDGERVGAAARRRGRRLRAWHRHVRTTVVTSVRRLPWSWRRPSTTARSRWMCPETERSTRSTTAYGHRSDLSWGSGRRLLWMCPGRRREQSRTGTWLPWFLGWRAIVSKGDDGVDGTTLRYLLQHAIEMRKAQEGEEEMEEATISSWGTDTAMWAWAPLSLFVVLCLLGFVAGGCQKDSCALLVYSGSGLCKVGFTGDYAPRSMFPSVDDRPKMLDIMAGTDQKNSSVDIGCMLGGFAGDSAPRAVFLSLSSGPRCAASWLVWIRSAVMSVLPGGSVPVVCNNRCFGSRSAENCGFSAVAVLQQGRPHPCLDAEAASHGPFWWTTEIPQLLLDVVIDVPVVGRAGAASAPRFALGIWTLFYGPALVVFFVTRRLNSTIRIFLEMTSRRCFHIVVCFGRQWVHTSSCISLRWLWYTTPTCRWTRDPEVNSRWPPIGS